MDKIHPTKTSQLYIYQIFKLQNQTRNYLITLYFTSTTSSLLSNLLLLLLFQGAANKNKAIIEENILKNTRKSSLPNIGKPKNTSNRPSAKLFEKTNSSPKNERYKQNSNATTIKQNKNMANNFFSMELNKQAG